MTTIGSERFTCPLCGNVFESMTITSFNTCGPLHSDLFREASGEQPVLRLVHTCIDCGYTGFDSDFEPRTFPPDFARLVAEKITPEVKGRRIETNGHYDLAAQCAQWRGATEQELGRIYQLGAWCNRVRGKPEKERFFLARAAECFEKALAAGQPAQDARVLYAYVIGDTYRRLGDPGRASEWLGRVSEMLESFGGDPDFRKLADHQMKTPKDILEREDVF